MGSAWMVRTALAAAALLGACESTTATLDTGETSATDASSDTSRADTSVPGPAGDAADADERASDAPPAEDSDAGPLPPSPPPAYLGGDRPAVYALPYGYAPGLEMPVVVSLHGFTGSAAWHDAYTGLSAATRERGVLLITPDGRVDPLGNRYWSATDACCNYHGAPDVDAGYLRGLVEEAADHFVIDRTRVAFVGHSNGGFMSHRMACQHSDLLTHVVSLAGTSWFAPETCGSPAPVSVWHLHGTWDTVVRYAGREVFDPQRPDYTACWMASCSEVVAACEADPDCATLTACMIGCGSDPAPQTCRDTCQLQAPVASRELWMDSFVCVLDAGCFDTGPDIFEPYPGAEPLVDRWVARSGCSAAADPTFADFDAERAGDETRIIDYGPCLRGTSVRFGRMTRSSHAPTLTPDFADSVVTWIRDTPRAPAP